MVVSHDVVMNDIRISHKLVNLHRTQTAALESMPGTYMFSLASNLLGPGQRGIVLGFSLN